MKRQDYLTWDEYFMGIAQLAAQRSKDNNTQVGACIVNDENKILSIGYNGMPTGCDDDIMPWERSGDPLETKYFYVCHAELNAILNYGGGSLKGARVYVTLFPCNECTKAIIQSGISEVVYFSDKYDNTDWSTGCNDLGSLGMECESKFLNGLSNGSLGTSMDVNGVNAKLTGRKNRKYYINGQWITLDKLTSYTGNECSSFKENESNYYDCLYRKVNGGVTP